MEPKPLPPKKSSAKSPSGQASSAQPFIGKGAKGVAREVAETISAATSESTRKSSDSVESKPLQARSMVNRFKHSKAELPDGTTTLEAPPSGMLAPSSDFGSKADDAPAAAGEVPSGRRKLRRKSSNRWWFVGSAAAVAVLVVVLVAVRSRTTPTDEIAADSRGDTGAENSSPPGATPPASRTSEENTAALARLRAIDDDLRRGNLSRLQRLALAHRAVSGLHQLQSLRVLGSSRMGGDEVEFRFFFRRPSLVNRTIVLPNGVERTDAFDGRTVWARLTNPQGDVFVEDITASEQGAEIITLARLGSPLLEFSSFPERFSTVPTGLSPARNLEAIRYQPPDRPDREVLILLNPDSLQVVQEVVRDRVADGVRESTVEYSDFREIGGGASYPFLTRLTVNGQLFSEVRVESVSINRGVPAFLFEVPDELTKSPQKANQPPISQQSAGSKVNEPHGGITVSNESATSNP